MISDEHNYEPNKSSNTTTNSNAVASPATNYINMLLNDTRLNSPSNDPRYLQLESSYTSGFHLRDEVDKFDFDNSLGNKTTNEQSTIDQNLLDYTSSDEDMPMDEQGDYNSEYGVQDFMSTVNDLKQQVSDWINDIDQTLSSNGSIPGYYSVPRVIVPSTSQSRNVPNFMKTIDEIKMYLTEDDLQPELQQWKRYGSVDIKQNSIDLNNVITNDPCSKLNNYGVILMRWPESIAQLWDEYSKIPSEWSQEYLLSFLVNVRKINEVERCNIDIDITLMRQSSIRDLENRFSSGWRNEDKNFSRQINRRKKIWNAIEDGLKDGVELDDCIKVLTQYVEETNKGLSLYYKGVPFRIIDRLHKIKYDTF